MHIRPYSWEHLMNSETWTLMTTRAGVTAHLLQSSQRMIHQRFSVREAIGIVSSECAVHISP
jgi:hypothetical protein